MKILAIETSCDDTGIAILEVKSGKAPEFTVLSNIVSSQQIHANYGGVFPMMAKREHQLNLPPVLEKALKEGKLLISKSQLPITNQKLKVLKKILEKEHTLFESTKQFLETYEKPDVDYIAVTHGPGLEPCLYVGVNFAKALSYFWDIPVIPVNHIEAHILVNFLPKIDENSKLQAPNYKQIPNSNILNPKTVFPAISLVVSGGHTQLILVKKIGSYKIIGETVDDAAGECFDKAARILNLGYPGGPTIARLAEQWKSQITSTKSQTNSEIRKQPSRVPEGPAKFEIHLPRPMMHTKDYNFSFSGLKTSVLYKVRDTDPQIVKSQKFIQEMCFAVQDAICDVLIKKTIDAAKAYKAKTIILGGGVSANQELRKQFIEKTAVTTVKEIYSNFNDRENKSIPVIFPDAKLSTDNGLMIAVAGYFNKKKKVSWKRLKVNANLRV